MERDLFIEGFINGLPLGQMIELPDRYQTVTGRASTRRSAKRMGYKVAIREHADLYYIIRMNDAPQHN